MITVMGASGRAGGAVARLLLDAGKPVRVIGRSAIRLAELGRAGADVRVGDAIDLPFLAAAFHGSAAAFTLLPYDLHAADYLGDQQQLSETVVAALHAAQVPTVVALSSVGADVAEGTGFVASLYDHEQRLRRLSGTDLLVLRAGAFFENLLEALPIIDEYGVYADNVAPDVPIPMIASGDVAAVAVTALRRRSFTGHVVRELLGPCDLTFPQAMRIISTALGRADLPYLRLPDDEFLALLEESGYPRPAARLQVELGRALSERRIVARERRGPANTTPTSLRDFLATH